MIALDVSVLARALTRDDRNKTAAVARLMAAEALYVCKTVLLELEWTLRLSFRFEREAIHAALVKLAGLPNLQLEDAPAVAAALALYEAGMDFGDALHLASSPGAVSAFATFERGTAQKAAAIRGAPAVRLL